MIWTPPAISEEYGLQQGQGIEDQFVYNRPIHKQDQSNRFKLGQWVMYTREMDDNSRVIIKDKLKS